jgi:site-specific recombinase XerD
VLIDRFLDWLILNRADGTQDFYKRALDSFKESVGQRLKVDDLRPHYVSTWVDTRYPKVSDTYKHNLIRATQRCFSWAIKQGHLDRSPLQHIEKPAQTHCGRRTSTKRNGRYF